ncbi:MAG: HAD-IA family hydrolase [Candidatus Methylumidiphilus sp.]
MKHRYDLLIFDWDGTLIDSIQWIVDSLNFAARECGFDVPPDRLARSVIGLSLERAMATLLPQAQAGDIAPLMAAYQHHYNSKPLGADALFDGVPALLDALRGNGHKLAVATGKTRAGLDHAISATGAAGWFDATRAAGETASKPDPLMLRQIMAELSVPPERTLMIGDSVHDMRMAQNAGVAAVGVFCGADGREQILPFQPLLGLERTADLLEFFL